MAGLCELASRLQGPILGMLRAQLPIVSAGHLENSRFWETSVGDRVRSAVDGPGGSEIWPDSPPWSAANWECRRGTAAPSSQRNSLISPPWLAAKVELDIAQNLFQRFCKLDIKQQIDVARRERASSCAFF
jgi:hypothetical protein